MRILCLAPSIFTLLFTRLWWFLFACWYPNGRQNTKTIITSPHLALAGLAIINFNITWSIAYQTKCFLLFRNDSFFCVSHLTNFMLAVGVIHAGTNRRRRESSAQFKHWRRFAREKQNRNQLMIKWNFLFINSEGQTECFFCVNIQRAMLLLFC